MLRSTLEPGLGFLPAAVAAATSELSEERDEAADVLRLACLVLSLGDCGSLNEMPSTSLKDCTVGLQVVALFEEA